MVQGSATLRQSGGLSQPESASREEVLALLKLGTLWEDCTGDPSLSIGIIDGPVDLQHPAFVGSSIETVRPNQSAGCLNARSEVCAHGTAIAGILCATRQSAAPAICPACRFLIYPIFREPSPSRAGSSTTPGELAQAIVETIDAGARIINLSLGVIPVDTTAHRELDEAVGYAARRGVILVAAAGNQGRIGFLPLFNHPWTISVAACDLLGVVTPESNVSPTIGSRGLRAPGVNILTTASGGGYAAVSGTSVAAALVTGAIALLWSRSPAATAFGLRTIVMRSALRRHRSIVPSLFDVESASRSLRPPLNGKDANMSDDTAPREIAQPLSDSPAAVMSPPAGPPSPATRSTGVRPQQQQRVVRQSGSCPSCAAGAAENTGPMTFVYAIGMIRMRFPSPSIEKEFAQAIAATKATASLTDQAVLHNALKENRYLANEVCWTFSVENVDAYLLVPRDQVVLDQFIEAVKPSQSGIDTDVIIGTQGPVAPPEMCNGLTLPIVLVDRVYSFEKPELVKAIKKPKELKMTEEQFAPSAEELFERILQMTDNVGATDEHRAINYLSMRYPQVYTHTAEMFGRDYSLTNLEVTPSRLTGARKLVNVILSYTNRATDVVEKYYVRVDVTEKFPFLDKKLTPYFDRD